MGVKTGISWCDHTFNPVRGCSKVSDGCKNCYAETLANRFPEMFGRWGPSGTRIAVANAGWGGPARWDEANAVSGVRTKVFTASLADVFEDWDGPVLNASGNVLMADGPGNWFVGEREKSLPVSYNNVRDRLHALIALTPNLDWLVLTKRPEVAVRYYADPDLYRRILYSADGYWRKRFSRLAGLPVSNPRYQANRWNGVSVEDQETYDARLPLLMKIPTPVHWLSMEPLLGPVDLGLSRGLPPNDIFGPHDRTEVCPTWFNGCRCVPQWAVVGGESHADRTKARGFSLGWARSLRYQCRDASVPFFLKQLGSHPVFEDADVWAGSTDRRLKDSHGADPAEWPPDLRVQEFPESPVGALLTRKEAPVA
jgi:protein gp37